MHFVDPQNTTRKRELPQSEKEPINTNPLDGKVATFAKKISRPSELPQISIPPHNMEQVSWTPASTPSDLPSDQVLTTTTTAQKIIAPPAQTSDPATTTDDLQPTARDFSYPDARVSGAIVRAKNLIEGKQYSQALIILGSVSNYISKMKRTDLKLHYFSLSGECSMSKSDHAHAIANYFLAMALEQNSEKKDQLRDKIRMCFQEGMNDAQKLHDQDNFQGAITKLSTLVGALNTQAIPKDVKSAYFVLQGNCFKRLGKHLAAIESFYKAEANVESSETKAELLYMIAHSFQVSRKPLNAFQVIDKALGIPNLKDSIKERFRALQIEATSRIVAPHVFEDEKLATSFLEEGLSKLKSNNYQDAIDCFVKGIKVAGQNPVLHAQFYYQLGWAYYVQNQFPNCIGAWESCSKFAINPKFKATLIQHIAIVCEKNNQFSKAEKVLQNAITEGLPDDTTGGIILCLLDLLERRKATDMNERICDVLLKVLVNENSFSDKMKGIFCTRLARAQFNSGNYQGAIATCTSGLLLKIDDDTTTKLLHCQVASHMRLQLLIARLSKTT